MRNGIFVAVTLWLTPVIAVGLTGVGLAHVAAIVMGFVLAAAIGRWASGPLAATLSPALAGRRVLTIAVLLVAAVAIVQIARQSVFMADSTRPAYSLMPGDPWRVEHSCMSAYFEAALESESRVNQDDPDGALIGRSSLCGPQYAAGLLRTGAIHNDGFETLAGEFANGGVSGVTVLDCDLKLAENAAQDAHRLLIGAYE